MTTTSGLEGLTQRPSDKQIAFARRLVAERKFGPEDQGNAELRVRTFESKLPDYDRRSMSQFIDWLLRQPVDEAAKPQFPKLEPGVYENQDGIFVVKRTRDGERLYAKRLVESPERMTEQDEFVPFDFVYESGAIRQLRPEHKMPFERAKALRIRYGRCINCGRTLKAAKSVKDADENGGFGPVCKLAYA